MKRLVFDGVPTKRDSRTREQLLAALEDQEVNNRMLLQEKNEIFASRLDLSVELTEAKRQIENLSQEVKDLEEEALELEEQHKKELKALEEEYEKRKRYLEGVGAGLSHAISVIVSGVTVPVNE